MNSVSITTYASFNPETADTVLFICGASQGDDYCRHVQGDVV
jgi:hypothetical protein